LPAVRPRVAGAHSPALACAELAFSWRELDCCKMWWPSSSMLSAARVVCGFNGLGFAISATTGSHYHLDLLGTGAFAATAWVLRHGDIRQRVSAMAMGVWAGKLAGFLFYRVLHTKHDARLDAQLATVQGAAGFWFVSAVWGIVVSLPHTLGAGVPRSARPRFGRWLDVAGLGIFAGGLILETVADAQKWAFKQLPGNRGRFCDVGVWQVSQHPNWFANILVWSGMLSLNAPTLLAAPGGGVRYLGAAAASPMFMGALFYAQATDMIASTQALADARYGDDPRYISYKASTPLLVPTPHSVWNACSHPAPSGREEL